MSAGKNRQSHQTYRLRLHATVISVVADADVRRAGRRCPRAKRLLIAADSGGSNGSRVRLWKWELQQLAKLAKLADQTGLKISVCH
jgi:hypothetical protein